VSRDSIEKLVIIAATALAAAIVASWQGLTFPPGDLANPLGIAALLGAAAWYYRRQGTETFVLCLAALLQITLYTACFSVLMYALAAIGRPLVDPQLVALDRLLGIEAPLVKSWAAQHPLVNRGLQWAYNSLLWQTPLVIVLLGFTGDRPRLEGFVRQFLLSTLTCAALFALWPAEGPFVTYGFAPSAGQTSYLEHLHGLRDGARTIITWRGAEGLITFPSFHTCWAILLACSLRGRGWITVAAVALNLAVILSTLTTGWHYVADVGGGCITAAAAIAASAAWVRMRARGPAVAAPRASAAAARPAAIGA
jgi:hypothetical protein